MESLNITCPQCNAQIPITEVMASQIEEKIRKSMESELREKLLVLETREQELKTKENQTDEFIATRLAEAKDVMETELTSRAEETYGTQLSQLQEQLGEMTQKLKTSQDNELSLRKQQKDLEERSENLELEVLRRIDESKGQWETDFKSKTQGEYEPILKTLRGQLEEVTAKLKTSQDNELQLLKKQEELDQKEKTLELEILRQVNESKDKIRTQLTEETDLKIREKEKQIQDMGDQINILKQKIEQGSQQLQGEVAELKLEEVLKNMFPYDTIEPVAKGVRGGDVIQKVFERQNYVGTILWESKRTKNWDNKWLDKLKQDQIDGKADLAILVTTVLPKEVENFACMEGIWVTDFACAHGLTVALRQGLIEVARTKIAAQGKNIKMEMIYDYLSGPEFRQKIVAIIDTFQSMKADLDKERRAMEKLWKQREKQIDRVSITTSQMYGEIQGIAGQIIPEIEQLELHQIAAGQDDGYEE